MKMINESIIRDILLYNKMTNTSAILDILLYKNIRNKEWFKLYSIRSTFYQQFDEIEDIIKLIDDENNKYLNYSRHATL